MMQRLKVAAGVVVFLLVALCAWGGIIRNTEQSTQATSSAGSTSVAAGVGVIATIVPPTATAGPTNTPAVTATPRPTATSNPTDTPYLTDTPMLSTSTPLPTVLVPETMEGLASLLLHPGDLPATWALDNEIYDEGPTDYEGPVAVAIANAGLVENRSKFQSGGMVIYIFSNESDAGRAFDHRSDVVTRNIDRGVRVLRPPYGNESMLAPGAGDVFIMNQLVFRRCRVVVEIQLGLRGNTSLIDQYAPRLDQRLMPTACKD